MKTELEIVLEKNALYAHLEFAIATLEDIIQKKTLKQKKPNERIEIRTDIFSITVSYNCHSVWFVLHAKQKSILHYQYSLFHDSYSSLACNVLISEQTHPVHISETAIHKKFIETLRSITLQVEDEIKKENIKAMKVESMKEHSSLELIKRSNMSQLFEEKNTV